MKLWAIVGGSDKGGILVREGAETSSPQLAERLATGAFVKELELQGGRLRFEKVNGDGPASGWVSLSISGKNLLAKAEELWLVVGGADKGGIVVREGFDATSPMTADRLSTGAWIRQVEIKGERVSFEKVTGTGPAKGWVSISLSSGKALIQNFPQTDASMHIMAAAATSSYPPGLPYGTRGEPLEVRTTNAEKEFSYEGLGSWVPKVAAARRLVRESKPYLPTSDLPLERLGLIKELPPYKRYPPKQTKELLQQICAGDCFGLPIPRTADQMQSDDFGAEWLTKAMHAAGTLPKDNRVTRVLRVTELDCTGASKEGGAAMKAFIDVEYQTPDVELHTALFAKYTWDFSRDISGIGMTMGQDDSLEVIVNLRLVHLFPFRAPKCYFADVSRENTSYIIISEAIPYGKRDGHEIQPYEVLPGLGKCQDHLLTNPLDYYFCCFRAMAQMGAWDYLGFFDDLLGKADRYHEAQYLSSTKPSRRPQTLKFLESARQTYDKELGKMVNFIKTWCPKIAAPELRDEATLMRVKAELIEMAPYFSDMSEYYQRNNSDFVGLVHANLQVDNAWFWRDAYGELDCGVLDWGGLTRQPFAAKFAGCVSGADCDLLLAHIEGLCQCFVDEYHRCGGPKLPVKELLLRFHLNYITNLYFLHRFVSDHVYGETPQEEFLTFTGILDERFQERFFTRCGTLPSLTCWTYYVKNGNMKRIFDEWASGAGKPFLSEFT
eukprot:TRINITY_DN28921_c0_g1_i1.p1 TRINITY_DN28921_c0_g1~~TRINITY_DN28921_c0_g1_i1.p1  ORF type:complete len:722 (-),score=108.87 TRINITY_DN28921_c0_g1_i1:144-2309(-)